MSGEATVLIMIAGFAVNILVLVVTGTWQLARTKEALIATMQGHRDALNDKIGAVEKELGNFKLEVARDYVSKWTFGKMGDRISGAVQAARDDVVARLMRIDDRITRAIKNGS